MIMMINVIFVMIEKFVIASNNLKFHKSVQRLNDGCSRNDKAKEGCTSVGEK